MGIRERGLSQRDVRHMLVDQIMEASHTVRVHFSDIHFEMLRIGNAVNVACAVPFVFL